jgi:hypothetical protein
VPCYLRNIPDWKKCLSVKENKQALIKLFGDFSVKFNQSNSLVPPGNLYYIAGSFGNPEIVKVVSDILYTIFLPFPKKEEIVLHPERACVPGRTLHVISEREEHSSVIVLCIYFDKQMTNTSELWVQMGNVSSDKDGRRFLPIHKLSSSLSEITCRVLPAAHALNVMMGGCKRLLLIIKPSYKPRRA